MFKSKYTKEILEMYYSGKSATEIVEIINAKYSTELSVHGVIQMNKGKQNENEKATAKMFPENQEGIQEKENSVQKGTEKQETKQVQENSEAKKMKKSDKSLIQSQIKSISNLTKELHNTFLIFSVINEEFGKAIKVLEERNRKNTIKYILFGGMFLMAMTFGMLWGYRDAHPGEDMSFAYIPLLCNILIGVLIGLGVPLIIKISQIIKRK